MPEFEIDCYWNPYDWFEPVMNGLREKWKCGMNATEIIDSENLGNLHEGMCRRNEAIKWLEQTIEEWEELWMCQVDFTTDIQNIQDRIKKKRTKSVEPPEPPTTANNDSWEYEIDL